VDGYCRETNTVYEYHGDYWHGNPRKYKQTDIHPHRKVTYGELYRRTLRRDRKIKSLGYNLMVKWESSSPHLYNITSINE
jgi:G:T-mismatch repair DNA endonuclease (very short patch repair protein)